MKEYARVTRTLFPRGRPRYCDVDLDVVAACGDTAALSRRWCIRVYFGLIAPLTKPVGLYLHAVFERETT